MQAEAEGLTLRKADNKTGYFGVTLTHPGQPKPYEARVSRGGKQVSLGCFATAEEAATARRTAPPPRRWRSCPGSPACRRAAPAPGRAWAGRA